MAEEVHFIHPESKWALSKLEDDPGHLLFKRFGESMPKGEWNEKGTKQGIYMMGPDGEYLAGAREASGNANTLRRKLEQALDRWKALRKEKKYRNRPVPPGEAVAPPEIDSAPLALRVSMRDLPRGKGDDSGRRVEKGDKRGRQWLAFTEWAWNQKWLALEDPRDLVTRSRRSEEVEDRAVQAIVRRALVDNVRGQNPGWKAEHVQEASLTMRATKVSGREIEIEYEGRAKMKAGEKSFAPTLFGRGTWDPRAEAFTALRIVAIGPREGAGTFNQRTEDKEAAPMGVLLELHRAPEPKKRRR